MTASLGKIKYALVLLFVILAANFLTAQALKQHVDNPGQTAMDPVPDDVNHTHTGSRTQFLPAVVTGNGINYHGGAVLQGNPVPIYLIFYGNWSSTGSNTAATVSLVQHFISTLGGSADELIATTYGDTTGNVSGNVSLGGTAFVNSTRNLTDRSLQSTVSNVITSGALPRDGNGVYMVLTSTGINETSGFCTQYCGFHTHATLGGVDIKYAFVGNPDRCPSGCEAQTTGPNSPSTGVGGADGMINVMSHEQFEAITDPDLNAWFDSTGQEDSDKCNFNFGAVTSCNANGLCSAAGTSAVAKYNQTFGNNNWLLQQQWENLNGGACVQHL